MGYPEGMIQRLTEPLAILYESDETAWLEAMAELIGEQRLDELLAERAGAAGDQDRFIVEHARFAPEKSIAPLPAQALTTLAADSRYTPRVSTIRRACRLISA